MSDARPQLVAIDGDALPGSRSGGRPAGAGAARPSLGRYGGWAAGVAFVCLVGWGITAYRASQLGEELAASQAALSAAQGQIEGYRAHLAQVRDRTGTLVYGMDALVGQLGTLASELELLSSLVSQDPSGAGKGIGEPPAQP